MRALFLASLLMVLGSGPALAGGSPLKDAQTYEAELKKDDGKMRLRHNLEKLVDLWSRAKKEDRRAALEGEARAWKLLAHWSGRTEDRAKADEAASKLDSKQPEAKREKKTVAPPPPVKEATTRAMLAKVELDGDRLHLEIAGAFTSKRDLIPAHAGVGARVFFDLTPVIAAREVLGNVKVDRAGVAKVRVGQFDDDTARVVIDLSPNTPQEAISIEGNTIAFALPADSAKPAVVAEAAPEHEKEITEPDLRAIVEEMKQVMPVELAFEREPAAKEEREELVEREVAPAKDGEDAKTPAAKEVLAVVEEADDEPLPTRIDVKRVAKVEPPLDEATMRSLKRSTRDAVKPREDGVASIRKVVIDAGHGGKDQGARGVNGALEKDVNLAVALKLGAELKRRLGVKVIFTRTTDQFLTLQRRSQLANAADADLFISVHANAHKKKSIYGIETYYLNTTSDRYSVRLARRENCGGEEDSGEEPMPEPDGMSKGTAELEEDDAGLPPGSLGRDLRLLLADLAMRSASAESKRLAGHVQSSMVGTLRRKHDDIKDLGVKHALFYVLLGARMPSILIETGFVTHNTEGKRLAESDYQNELASSIAQGIARWVAERDALVKKSDLRDQTLASMR